MSSLDPYMASNPYLQAVQSAMPSGRAAYSQDIGKLLFNFSGQSLPINTFPNFNPFGYWQGGILPGLQGLGFM
jgi:hypothetical protein